MKVDRKQLELAMARACMESRDLPAAAGLPRPTVQTPLWAKASDLQPWAALQRLWAWIQQS